MATVYRRLGGKVGQSRDLPYNLSVQSRLLIAAAGLGAAVTLYATAQTLVVPTRTDRLVRIQFGVVDPPIVKQADITVEAPTSNQRQEPAPLECSGLVYLPLGDGAGRLIVASDRHEHLLFNALVDTERLTVTVPEPTVIVRNERELLADIESLTHRRNDDGRMYVYGTCSWSNAPDGLPRPARRFIFRVAVNDRGEIHPPTFTALRIDHLRKQVNDLFVQHQVEPYRAFSATAPGGPDNTYRWGNVEGIAFSPDGRYLVCGMRNPTLAGDAIVFVITGVEEAFTAGDPRRMKISDALTLDLGGRGVSDLAWDPVTEGFLISAALSNGPKLDDDRPYPPDQLNGAAFWWSGRRDEGAVMFAQISNMLPEAICRLGQSPLIAIGTDEGDVSEAREQRQSRLILMHFNGLDITP